MGQHEVTVDFVASFNRSSDCDFTLFLTLKENYRPQVSKAQATNQVIHLFLPLCRILKKPIYYIVFTPWFQANLNGQIAPQEALKRERAMQKSGYYLVPVQMLRDMQLEVNPEWQQGAVALIACGIIRDDFSIPVGLS